MVIRMNVKKGRRLMRKYKLFCPITFCYLSAILDACTKQVLVYAMSESLEVDFVLEIVEQMVKRHRVLLSRETVIHSDLDPFHQLEIRLAGGEPGAVPLMSH